MYYGWSSHYDGTEPILKMAVRDFCTNVPSTQIEDKKKDDDIYIDTQDGIAFVIFFEWNAHI